uniref:Uncharacterized protein n=1 Tax=Sphaerodactylus townsendi TaxID=933632 RepID=A0ACB8EI45_9SAUR
MADFQRCPKPNTVMEMSDCNQPRRVCLLPNAANSIEDLLEQIITEQGSFGQDLISLSSELAKFEKHLEDTDHRVVSLEAKMVSTQGCVVKHSTLMRELAAGHQMVDCRLETLKNKVRARNLRITGVPAAVKDVNLIPFIENLVPAALDLNGIAAPVCIENAYRLPARNIQEEKMTVNLIRNRLGLLVLGVLVTFVLYLLLPVIQPERFTSSVDIPKPLAVEEDMKKGPSISNVTILTGTVLQNPSVFFREAILVQKDGAASTERLWRHLTFKHFGDSTESCGLSAANLQRAKVAKACSDKFIHERPLCHPIPSGQWGATEGLCAHCTSGHQGLHYSTVSTSPDSNFDYLWRA